MSRQPVTQAFATDEPEIDSKATDYQRKENEPSSENVQASAPNALIPCATTGSIFLYAQGTSIVCYHHDTLAIERIFSNHADEVILLAVDNDSKLGRGRHAVSYDAGQVAIVWDLLTGDEFARFVSYEPLTAAVWMRNGNAAFGNTKGSIILFEPITSAHVSIRTLDQIKVTALAPLADCQTFAIGYENGGVCIATLHPRFKILHYLATSERPSPIVTLSWHALSPIQASYKLATQARDGDLRVWSVPESHSDDNNDPSRVIRQMKKTDDLAVGPQWISWSRGGRIIQFTGRDSIPTLEQVRGIANYGPYGPLFTLGADNTVQQFDVDHPSIMVANVQHPKQTAKELVGSISSIMANTTSVYSSSSESGDDKPGENDKVDEANDDVGELKEGQHAEYGEDDVKSFQSSTFDLDIRSKVTRPSTMPTSHPSTKPRLPPEVSNIAESCDMVVGERTEVEVGDGEGFRDSHTPADGEAEQQQPPTDDCDAETTYSIDSRLDDPKLQYLQVFAEQLADDINSASADLSIEGIEAEYLDTVLREFAWKLHGESSNPFEWEASVVLHRKRKNIVELLVSRPSNLDDTVTQLETSGSSEDGESDELPERTPFNKPRTMVMQWVGNVEISPVAAEESAQVMDIDLEKHITIRLSSYRSFIKKSEAYHWLLNKIRQYGQLDFQNAEAMLEIGSKIQSQLRAQGPLRKMSSRKPLSLVKMMFNLEWDPVRFMKDAGIAFLFEQQFPRLLCLTGWWNEAQALTVADYTSQTWPRSGQALISLLQDFLSHAENRDSSGRTPDWWNATFQHKPGHGTGYSLPTGAQLMLSFRSPSSCSISVTGCLAFVSEIGEQIGWLASALRASPVVQGTLACTPHIGDFQMTIEDEGTQKLMVVGSCNLTFDLEPAQTSNPTSGSCWGGLCCNAMLVHGYPIARRSEPNTGLEMSLGNMATIVGSNQIVHWNGRVIMKGFSMLLIATLAATDIIVWHLLVSEKAGERISYIDPRLDTLGIEPSKEISLRMLEPSRHVIGWCSKVTDFCGDATANHNIKTSGLKTPPASIIIDRLYLEAGSDVVGGLNMSFNKKEQPFWLERESDYPSLLKWMAVQPILFYDVEDCRAWLIDGASALLHLVRISLHLEENDPESTYDWVFEVEKLKDKWDGLIGRQAALQTLKSWDNLDLNVYVTGKRRRSDGVSETQYSTLETRIKKVLHSIEILIDRQAKVVSQDGIRISQTLNLRRNITGFDILDVLTPLGPILPRIKYLDSWRYGWDDLINSIGVTTIFGSGFGSLIRPDDPEAA
ncbi:hypothetical protein FAVG1_11611 [Fusarium avenaceum]|nr:hypothetical protein FAVG1_11611 [Fusarium avenaceum]